MANFNCFVDSQTAKMIYEDQNRALDDFNKFWSFTIQLDTTNPTKIAAIKTKLDEKGFSAETFADQEKRTYDAIGILQIGLNFFAFIVIVGRCRLEFINTLVVAVMERTKINWTRKKHSVWKRKVFLLFSLGNRF